MGLIDAAAANDTALVRQLYDEWGGHYVLRRLLMGAWCDVRPLSRSEALTIALRPDEALLIVYPQRSS
jgi:hypothetical protein